MKPLFVFDGDCGFCRHWIARWKHVTKDRIDYAPYQDVAGRFPDMSKREFENSVRLIEPDGRRYGGAEAVFRALAHAPGKGRALKAYQEVPGMALASEAVYRFVAAHRPFFSRLTLVLWGRTEGPDSFVRTRWVFLRLLGIVYLIAFLSLGEQVVGLMGREGILPAADYLGAVRNHYGGMRFGLVPTLFWFWSTDAALRFVCWSGAAFSVLLVIGFAPIPILVLLWASYLSLASVGGDFLSFQWDNLLLETGFLAIWFAPGGGWPGLGRDRPPSRWVLFLLRWLLFRLMFSSGVVKLMSGDPGWQNLTALQFHYETQPLPAITSWFAHHLPSGIQKFSVFSMFVIELAVPFLIFLPRKPRLLAFAAFTLLQILIGATGNYAFFNLLTFTLSLLLLDDAYLVKISPPWRRGAMDSPRPEGSTTRRRPDPSGLVEERGRVRVVLFRRISLSIVSTVILVISSALLLSLFERPRRLPESIRRLYGIVAPYRSISGYGLFAVMTTERNEIVIEGSDDQETWKEYEFRWKPGDVQRAPSFVQPHQPRLDWQMWFAALSRYEREPWFGHFMVRLLQGSPQVHRILERNPFAPRPPTYVRAVLYRYRFTTPEERRRTGAWWRRDFVGPYTRILSLKAER